MFNTIKAYFLLSSSLIFSVNLNLHLRNIIKKVSNDLFHLKLIKTLEPLNNYFFSFKTMYPILSANDLKNKILLLTVISKKIKITKYLAQFYK